MSVNFTKNNGNPKDPNELGPNIMGDTLDDTSTGVDNHAPEQDVKEEELESKNTSEEVLNEKEEKVETTSTTSEKETKWETPIEEKEEVEEVKNGIFDKWLDKKMIAGGVIAAGAIFAGILIGRAFFNDNEVLEIISAPIDEA